MGSFLYFFPVAATLDRFRAERPEVFDVAPTVTSTTSGPNGMSGSCAVYPGDRALQSLQRMAACQWREARLVAGDADWIGVDPENMPTPDELALPCIRSIDNALGLPSAYYNIRLGDENEWFIFIIWNAMRESPLPKVRDVNPDGTLRRRVASRYEELLKLGDRVWEAFERGEVFSEEDAWASCVQVLSAAYRVGPHEIGMLELLTDETVFRILCAMVQRKDWKA